MKNIKVFPFPNHKITDEAYERSVKGNSSNDKEAGTKMLKKAKSKSKVLVAVNTFDDGERRVNYAVPLDSKGTSYWAVFPNPIHLYLSQAINQIEISKKVLDQILPEDSKVLSSSENIRFLNLKSDNSNSAYNLYLQYRIGAIVMLVCSLEGFLNFMLPEELQTKNRKGDLVGKEVVQRHFSIQEKIDKVLPELGLYNVKNENPKIRSKILELIQVRNDFVHLKNEKKAHLETDYHRLFLKMQKFDIETAISSVIDYINSVKPEFIMHLN